MLRHSVSTLLYKGMILSLTFFIFLLSTYNYHVYNKTLLIFTSFFKENFHNFHIISAIISSAIAAPWRCGKTQDGSTICFGDIGQPSISPPSISVQRPSPPCSDSALIYTPPIYPPCPNPCFNPRPCPCPV